MNFNPELCRNESEVISKLIVSYLLPQLGFSFDSWHQEVKFANFRLDLLALATPVFPSVLDRITRPAIIIEAKHPKERLSRHTRKLIRYLINLNVRFGLLTNGKELKIYEKTDNDEIHLRYECSGWEINNKIDDICSIIGKKRFTKESSKPTVMLDKHIDDNCSPIDISKTETSASILNKESKKMQIIAIYHNKGGVGKTTVSANLAASLSNKGKKVLLIDMDAQANTTFATGLIKFQFEEDDDIINKYVYHLLESGDFNFIDEIKRQSDGFNEPEIDVIPSHIDLIVHQEKLTKIAASRTRLIVKLNQVKNHYDIVIIDTPPSRDLYAEIPLIAADHLIIPSDLKPFANQGLSNVKNFIKEVNEYRESIAREPLNVLGVLPSKVSTNAQYLKHTFPRQKSVIPDRHKLPLMETIIYERTALSNCVSRTKKMGEVDIPDPKSIFSFCEVESTASAEQSAGDFELLSAEILNKIS